MFKPAIAILFFLNSLCLQGQDSSPSFKITFKDCRSDNRLVPFPGLVKLYRLPGDSVSYKLRINLQREFPVIGNFVPGRYRLQYRNLFGELIDTTILLDNCGPNELTICVDRLTSYTQQSTENLIEGDSIVVDFASEGCFTLLLAKLVITKIANDYFATLYRIARYSVFAEQKPDTLTAKLSVKNLADFKRFENELNFVKPGSCTSVDHYVISAKDFGRKAIDGNCDWNGFLHLCRSIFGKDFRF